MANQTITQLPDAGPITGTELVPIVQNGGTYKTTTAALAGSPVQTQTFLTLLQEPTLANSRRLSSGTGIGLTDNGAQSTYQISLNGVSGSLETMGNGFGVNVGGTMTARSIAASGAGLSIADGDGQLGNPTLSLDGTVASLANSSGTGFLALPGNGTVSGRTLTGTANQIGITNPNGIADNPTFSIADNAVLPGTGGVVVPVGTTGQRGSPTLGNFRYNTTAGVFEGYNGSWTAFALSSGVSSISFGTTGLTPSSATTGAIIVSGTLVVANGGTGVTTSTGSGSVVLSNSPTLVTPALGTPSSGVVTNLTGTASININGTVGATTPAAGSFTNITGSANAVISVTDNTNAALRITQLGTGNALLVEDSTNPDSTPVVVDSSGRVLIGNTTSYTVDATGLLQLTGTTNAHQTLTRFTANSFEPSFNFGKSRGSSPSALGIVSTGDSIGQIKFTADDGAAFIPAASIIAAVDGTPGTNDMPGRLVFSTTADGASSPTERMRITSTGQTTISGNAIISVTDNTNAALRITQLGTGNALLVEDSANPDSTPVVIDANGVVVVGTTSAVGGSKLQVADTTSAAAASITAWRTATTGGGSLLLNKSRSGTPGTYSIVSSGDTISTIRFAGDDGVGFIPAAEITAAVDGTPGTSDMPGRLVFSTTADGAATSTERVRINSTGNVLIGTTTNTNSSLLVVNGEISETVGGVQYEVVSQADIGTAPNEIPLNQYLGNLAYQDAANIAGPVGVGGALTANDASAINANSTSAALRITQLGTGNALLVEDSTNPDATPFVIDASGRVIVGNTISTTYSTALTIIPNLQINAAGAATSGISRFSANTAANSYWFLKSRGATVGAFDVVVSGDTLGTLGWLGADGTDGVQAATITAFVDGTPGTNDMPGRLVFSTTADGASTPTERMRINSAGNLGIGTSSPSASALLDVQSTTKGVRMPNMTTTQKNAIASPAAGLMVFDTTLAKLSVYSGVAWETITSV
jgi:predicted NAD-dependent protein-ADP-ribosyltransferase YbiA (DUF1768 family)